MICHIQANRTQKAAPRYEIANDLKGERRNETNNGCQVSTDQNNQGTRLLETELYSPRRLNLLVNVLPQPGTGHLNSASFLRRLALATWVAVVVTTCFSTCIMGRKRVPP